MKKMSDLERLAGRINLGTASPRDLVALARSLAAIPELRERLNGSDSDLIAIVAANLADLPELQQLIRKSIADEPPSNISDGGV
ncbi:hypothetical protein OFC23_29945, partial [Escherichia coli]|nr:hypothetical protein [Escherichia coli]